jgi:hypothetical protein
MWFARSRLLDQGTGAAESVSLESYVECLLSSLGRENAMCSTPDSPVVGRQLDQLRPAPPADRGAPRDLL